MTAYDTKPTPDAETPDGSTPTARIFTLDAAADPHPAYARLRAECPVHRGTGWDGNPQVMVSRYEDVICALRSPEIFSSAPEAVNIGQEDKLIPLQVDPPDHAKYRRLLDP